MIPELGHYALVLALALALAQSSVPLIGVRNGDAALMDVARSTALVQFVIAEADVMTAPGQGEQAPGESTSPA